MEYLFNLPFFFSVFCGLIFATLYVFKAKEYTRLSKNEAELMAKLLHAQDQLTIEKTRLQERSDFFQRSIDEMTHHFKNIAHEVLEEKLQKSTQTHQEQLGHVLNPLKDRLDEFQKRINHIYAEEGKDRSALGEQVRQLMLLNQSIGQEAKNLTQALKGSNKIQGNWGELILEKILETTGLRKGIEFDTQVSHTKSDGSRAQPDVVIHLPQNRHLIVDAKVSLLAYEKAFHAEKEDERQLALRDHLSSIKKHIKELSERHYQQLYQDNHIDFVILFVPIEAAFLCAIQKDAEVLTEAWHKNILLVSPSTLFFVVRYVSHLWRQEQQQRHAIDIAHRGAELYDKLVGFVKEMESLGSRLHQAQEAYEESMKKLTHGRGNVIRQAEMLKEWGVKPSKDMPQKTLDQSEEI